MNKMFGVERNRKGRVGAMLLLLAMAGVSRTALPAYAADGPTVPRTTVEVTLRSQSGY